MSDETIPQNVIQQPDSVAIEPEVFNIIGDLPIPVFVIDKDHKIIHWNAALERVSGIRAGDVMGTDQHWRAFYSKKRPCMADFLVDGAIDEIPRWYADKYVHSRFVEGAYEAEDFFPAIGETGKWLRFTAAAIRNAKGAVIGAVESLEDITEQKNAEEGLQFSHFLLHGIIESSPHGIFSVDRESRYTSFNKAHANAMKAMYGKDIQLGRSLYDFQTVEKDRTLARSVIERAMKGERIVRESFSGSRNRSRIYLEHSLNPIRDEHGGVIGVSVFSQDITARKQVEMALRQSESRFQKLLSLVPDMISIQDTDMNIVYSNWSGFAAVPEEKRILGTKCYQTYRGYDRECRDCHARSVLYTKAVHEEERALSDGRWARLRVAPILDDENNVAFFVEWIRDITERKQAEKKLERLAAVDDLTGLWNRRYFMNALDHEMERARRYGQCFSILTIDIDHFKVVNDTHGHAAGDAVLQHMAGLLKDGLRQTDMPGRVGGEEFSILLPNTGLEDAASLAERLRMTIEKTPAVYDGQALHFTVSIGLADYHRDSGSIDELMLQADKALYKAKEIGRNQVVKKTGP